MANERIAVIYCGSSHTKDLYDLLLHYRTFPVVFPHHTSAELLHQWDPEGIIITGSDAYVNAPRAPKLDRAIYNLGIPMLGICYGMQIMAKQLGGTVRRMHKQEKGTKTVNLVEEVDSPLFRDFTREGAPLFMAHGCLVTELPDGFVRTAYTDLTPVAAMEDARAGLYGVQFHPEKLNSKSGEAVLWSFLEDVCDCSAE